MIFSSVLLSADRSVRREDPNVFVTSPFHPRYYRCHCPRGLVRAHGERRVAAIVAGEAETPEIERSPPVHFRIQDLRAAGTAVGAGLDIGTDGAGKISLAGDDCSHSSLQRGASKPFPW